MKPFPAQHFRLRAALQGNRLHLHAFICLWLVSFTTKAQDTPAIAELRMQDATLRRSLESGLRYLAERQVHETPFQVRPSDFAMQRAHRVFGLHHLRSGLSNRLIGETHLPGAWPGFVSFIPGQGKPALQPFFMAADYSLFITASTALCLRYLRDAEDRSHSPQIRGMKTQALHAVRSFRRGSSYAFWQTRTKGRYNYPRTSPPNIPVGMITFRKRFNDRTGLWGLRRFREADYLTEWVRDIDDPEKNTGGPAALFNIPADADDSALALALQLLLRQEGLTDTVDMEVLQVILSYRDSARTKTDRHNRGLEKDSKGILTWHKDENLPVFSKPEEGIIPFGTNNVDLVVNANVLLAMNLAGTGQTAERQGIEQLLAGAVQNGLWKRMSIYYPETAWFPYALSRALWYAPEAPAGIMPALPELMREVLNMRRTYNDTACFFPALDGNSHSLSTALLLNTLLNLGPEPARQAGLHAEYNDAVKGSLHYLVQQAKGKGAASARNSRKKKPRSCYWVSGPLFSSSVQDLAYWYSNPLTTALVVEAISKYLLGFDLPMQQGNKRRSAVSVGSERR